MRRTRRTGGGRAARLATALLVPALAAPAVALLPGTASAAVLQPTTTITPAAGCIVLTPGMNGVKVKLVQRRLGLPASTWETMDAATIARVRAFQTGAGLPADGVVGPATWRALGIAEDFCMDRFQLRPQLPVTATPAQRVETFVAAASSYLGDEYVWGGAGPKGYGVDCSGLVLQALYAAGLDPQPISVDRHVLPDYRTSIETFAYPGFVHAPLSQVQRGDLVYYTDNTTHRINHVAIALGGGRLLEASGSAVHTSPLDRTLSTQTVVREVVRPFVPAATAGDRAYVGALYRDLLGRAADPAGLDGWSSELAAGRLSRLQVTTALVGTDEHLLGVVAQLYRDVLHREPDDAGLHAWAAVLRAGTPPATLAALLHASDEAYARSGASAADPGPWVDELYRALLGRPADAAGRAAWVAAVRSAGRPAVAAGFYASPESLGRRVQAQYTRLLGRTVDPTGLATWSRVVAAQGELVLVASIATSDEYVARAQIR